MIRRAFKYVREFLQGLFAKAPALRRDATPDFVKAQLPPSSFTKKGPGVTARLLEALRGMTQEQRQVCQEKGWDRGLLRKSSSGKWRC